MSILIPLKVRIKVTDELIDKIMYRLYGPTEDEIKIMEGEKLNKRKYEKHAFFRVGNTSLTVHFCQIFFNPCNKAFVINFIKFLNTNNCPFVR